jgi:hypothetical protein
MFVRSRDTRSFSLSREKTGETDAKIVSPPSEKVYFLLLSLGRGKSEAKLKLN